jgi:hypothetical protein
MFWWLYDWQLFFHGNFCFIHYVLFDIVGYNVSFLNSTFRIKLNKARWSTCYLCEKLNSKVISSSLHHDSDYRDRKTKTDPNISICCLLYLNTYCSYFYSSAYLSFDTFIDLHFLFRHFYRSTFLSFAFWFSTTVELNF